MSWCRICHEHDCGIDHDPARVIKPRKVVSKADKKALLRKTAEVTTNAVIRQRLNSRKPNKSKVGMAIKPSYTQLKLF